MSNALETLRNAIKNGPAGIPPVSERVKLFQEAIKNHVDDCHGRHDFPNSVFELDWDQDEPAQNEKFVRQILQSCSNTKWTSWHDMVKHSTPQQRVMLEKFTAGASLQDVFEDFDFDSTRGTRAELGDLHSAKTEHLQLPAPSQRGIVTRISRWFTSCIGPQQVDVGLYEDAQKQKPLEVT